MAVERWVQGGAGMGLMIELNERKREECMLMFVEDHESEVVNGH